MLKKDLNDKNIMKLMKEIKYGWLDKYNNIHYIIDENFSKEYKLQSPEEILKNKVGVCWDQVELERYYFEKINYKTTTYFLVYYNDSKCPTHTFLVYKKNDNFYWFEHSWEKYQGIHKYNSIEELLKDVKNKFIKSELRGSCVEENIIIREYLKPKSGLNLSEFFNHCENGKII